MERHPNLIQEINTDSHEILKQVEQRGSLKLSGAIDSGLKHELAATASDLETQLLSEREARVIQEFETVNYRYPDETPEAVNRLGAQIEAVISPVLPEWRPNDVAIQRYHPGHAGIGWHRDYLRDKLLVAVATIEGWARFDIEVYDTPNQSHLESFYTNPGDIVLLRAPGLNEADDRPYHRIFPPEDGVRTSIAFRYNQRVEGHDAD